MRRPKGEVETMRKRASNRLGMRFLRDKAANVAILFGLSLFPIIFTIGAAIDYGRAYYAQKRLWQAIDAAALAVGSTADLSDKEIQRLAMAYIDANYPPGEIGNPNKITVSSDSSAVTIDATGYVETTFLRIGGFKTIDVGAHVEVTKNHKKVELVMVLDNTGSMSWNGKIGAVKKASKTLLDILMPKSERSANGDVKIGLVPFAAAVNIGEDKINSGWIDTNALSDVAWEDFADGANVLVLYDGITNRSWNGCVRARTEPYDTSDTPPSAGNPATLWAPYLAPDEPDVGSYSNNYQSDKGYKGGRLDYDARQRYTGKYDDFSIYGSRGPDFNCQMPELTPLTANYGQVESGINAMTASGNTVIPAGLAWGWRVISPSEPFTEGASYDDDDYIKAIVLLTDGENNVGGGLGNHNGSQYSAYGYAQSGHLGSSNGRQAESVLNDKTEELCDNIKDAGVLLYTITFQLNNNSIKDLMKDCASSTSMYYDSPSNSELKTIFEEIAVGLSKLRISK